MKLHSGHIQSAVVQLLNYRVYTVVPNVFVSYNHEADLIAIKDGKLTEIEIKISISDLKADFKKPHRNKQSQTISRLIYAFPEIMLEKAIPHIPLGCGIITVKEVIISNTRLYVAKWYRQARHNNFARPYPKQIEELMRLGCMRIWSLKAHNNKGLS